MKENALKKSKMVLVFALLSLLTILFISSRLFHDEKVEKDVYSANIIVETKKDKTPKKYYIDLSSDGEVVKVKHSESDKNLYSYDDFILYKEDNRLKKIVKKNNYSKVLNILKKMPLEDKGNISVSKDLINELFDSLYIDAEVSKDTVVNYELVDKKIDNFSIFLNDLKDFESLTIKIYFDFETKVKKIDKPILYEEVTDTVEIDKLSIN